MNPGIRVGILGGGQLARMLVIQGHQMGLSMHVLCDNKDDPAAQVTGLWKKGSPLKWADVSSFLSEVDFLTFESEFVPAQILEQMQDHTPGQAFVFPQPQLLKILQDRLSQKNLLLENSIPTSPFLPLQNSEDLEAARVKFKNACVLKKRLGGYDGKGTFILKSGSDFKNFVPPQPIDSQIFIAEALIKFKRELAIQVARNKKGDIQFLPLVEIHQKDHRLDSLRGPVSHPRLSPLKKKLAKFLTKINYVGVIAFELFDTGTELIVNEIAPRVHNSAHYSIEALQHSQFALHLMAVTHQDLPDVRLVSKAFAMTNLIGNASKTPDWPSRLSGNLHWYGKKENSKGRKIGHVTYLGAQSQSLVKLALKERKRMKL